MQFEFIANEKAAELISRFCTGIGFARNKYLTKDDTGFYIAIDNCSGDCWVESFQNLWAAVYWLTNEDVDIEEIHQMDFNITDCPVSAN